MCCQTDSPLLPMWLCRQPLSQRQVLCLEVIHGTAWVQCKTDVWKRCLASMLFVGSRRRRKVFRVILDGGRPFGFIARGMCRHHPVNTRLRPSAMSSIVYGTLNDSPRWCMIFLSCQTQRSDDTVRVVVRSLDDCPVMLTFGLWGLHEMQALCSMGERLSTRTSSLRR